MQEECEISASTINRHLNDLLGMTFYEYLTYMRLEHACKLLNSTDMIIDAVSDMSGFSSVRTFQRQFKEKYNLSPSQYRKLKRS